MDDELLKWADGLKPLTAPKGGSRAPEVDTVLRKMRDSIETQESGGNQKARNQRTSATGLFQVMPANIPVWTKKYYKRPLSQQEFANDREAQEAVFNGEMGKYVQKALQLADGDEDKAIRMASAAWYGGEGNMKNYDANFGGKGNEPTFREYTTSVLNRIKKGKPSTPAIDIDAIWADANELLQPSGTTSPDDIWAGIETEIAPKPVTEPIETIQAQIASAADPKVKTRYGVLTTDVSQDQVFGNTDGFAMFTTPQGNLWVNVDKAKKQLKLKSPKEIGDFIAKNPNALTRILGIAENVGDATADKHAVTARDPQTDVELASAAVTTPDKVVEQTKSYAEQFPGATIETTTTDDVAKRREIPKGDEWKLPSVPRLPNRTQAELQAEYDAAKRRNPAITVDEFNNINRTLHQQDDDWQEVDRVVNAAKAGRSIEDDYAVDREFEAEKAKDPTLTPERFNAQRKAKREAEFLAKNPEIAELTKLGLSIDDAIKEYNIAQKASVEGANAQNKKDFDAVNADYQQRVNEYNSKLPKQRQQTVAQSATPTQPTKQTQPTTQKDGEYSFFYQTDDPQTEERERFVDAMVKELGISPSVANAHYDKYGWSQKDTLTQMQERKSARQLQTRKIPAYVKNQLLAQDADVKRREESVKATVAEQEKNIDTTLDEIDRDLEKFKLEGQARVNAGLLKQKDFDAQYDALKKSNELWKEDRGFLGIWNQKEWADVQRFLGGRPDTSNRPASESYQPSGLGQDIKSPKDYLNKAYDDMRRQYGDATQWVKAQKEYKARFEKSPLTFIAKGAEAGVGGVMKAPFQAASSALKAIAIASEGIDKAIGGDQREAKDRYSYILAKGIDDVAEGIKVDKDFKGSIPETFGKVAGQVLIQTGLGIATGGAAAPAILGGMGGMEQGYEEGTKEGLSGWARLGKSLAAGLIEAPEYFIFRSMLKGGKALEQISAVQNLKATVERGLIAKGIAAPVAEKMAVATADGFVAQMIAKGGWRETLGKSIKAVGSKVAPALGEGVQEGTTRPLNDLAAFIMYDRSPERWDRATSLQGSDLVGGLAGVFGGAVGVTAAQMATRVEDLSPEQVTNAETFLAENKDAFPEETYNTVKQALENRKAYFAKDAQIQTEVQPQSPQVEQKSLVQDQPVEVQSEAVETKAPKVAVDAEVVEPVITEPSAKKGGQPVKSEDVPPINETKPVSPTREKAKKPMAELLPDEVETATPAEQTATPSVLGLNDTSIEPQAEAETVQVQPSVSDEADKPTPAVEAPTKPRPPIKLQGIQLSAKVPKAKIEQVAEAQETGFVPSDKQVKAGERLVGLWDELSKALDAQTANETPETELMANLAKNRFERALRNASVGEQVAFENIRKERGRAADGVKSSSNQVLNDLQEKYRISSTDLEQGRELHYIFRSGNSGKAKTIDVKEIRELIELLESGAELPLKYHSLMHIGQSGIYHTKGGKHFATILRAADELFRVNNKEEADPAATEAATEAATSPKNDLPEPSEAQIEAEDFLNSRDGQRFLSDPYAEERFEDLPKPQPAPPETQGKEPRRKSKNAIADKDFEALLERGYNRVREGKTPPADILSFIDKSATPEQREQYKDVINILEHWQKPRPKKAQAILDSPNEPAEAIEPQTDVQIDQTRPWLATREDYVRQASNKLWAIKRHRAEVKSAIERQESLPPEVLADYPDLAKRAAITARKAERADAARERVAARKAKVTPTVKAKQEATIEGAKAIAIPRSRVKKYAYADEVADQIATPEFKEMEAKSATERPSPRTGFTKTQTEYIAKTLEQYAKDYPQDAKYAGEGVTQEEASRKASGFRFGGRTEIIESEMFAVPDDGVIRITDLQQANRLYKKITGKPLDAKLPKETVRIPSDRTDYDRVMARPTLQGKPNPKALAQLQAEEDTPLRSTPERYDDIVSDRGDVDYDRAKDVAGRVRKGSLEIKRLDPSGEQGRVAGGQRAIEATIILAGNETASEKSGSRIHPVKRQERLLEEYAKREGIWFAPQNFTNIIGKGVEALVYEADGDSVHKIVNYKQINPRATPLDFIDNRIALFNNLFPATPYELVGFVRDAKGDFRFVVKQPFIRDAVFSTPTERQAYMEGKGLTMTDKSGEEFANEIYHVRDLHGKNALKMADGTIVAIDAVPTARNVQPLEIVEADRALRSTPDTKNLIAVHNLSAANLLFADKMGGLALPSIAVTSKDSGFDGFGEISLLADKSLIDPKNKVPVTDADMYSPRYPSATFEVDQGRLATYWKDVVKTWDSHYGKDALPEYKRHGAYEPYQMLADIESEGLRAIENNDMIMAQYLAEKKIPFPEGDEYALRKFIRNEHLADFADYSQDVLEDVSKGMKFFDGWTYNGKKRFKPYTLEAVVKKLKSEMKSGENWNYGAGNIRAAAAKRFKTIAEIQKDRGRIVTDKQMEEAKEEMNRRLMNLADEAKPHYQYDTERFGYYDQFTEALADGLKSRNLRRTMEEYGFEGLDYASINSYLDTLRNQPTEYFEAKPQRAVGLNEFVVAVVPDDLGAKARSILEKNELEIVEYKRGDKADRQRAVNEAASANEVLFKLRNADDLADLEKLAQAKDFRPIMTALQTSVLEDANGANILSLDNNETSELFRTALAIYEDTNRDDVKVFDGLYLNKDQTQGMLDTLEGMRDAAQAKSVDTKALDAVIANFEEATRANGRVRLETFENARRHETIHQQSDIGSDGKSYKDRYANADEIANSPAFKKFHEALNKVQGDTKIGVALEEALAYLGDGDYSRFGLTQDEAKSILKQLIVGYAEANGLESLSAFDHTELYEEIESFRKSQSSEVGNDTRSGVDSGREARPRPAGQKTRRDADGKGEEARDAKKSGERLRSLPGTLREAGVDAVDEAYNVFGNQDAIEAANNLIADLGLEKAIKTLEASTTYDKTHAVMSFMLQRALRNEATIAEQNGDAEYAQKLRERGLELASRHAQLATQAGQFTQAAAMVADAVESVIYHAEKIAQKRGKPLTPVEYETFEKLGVQVENQSTDLTRLRKDIRNLKAQIKRLQDAKPRIVGTRVNKKAIAKAQSTLPDMTALIKQIREGLRDADTALRMVADLPLRSTPDITRERLITYGAAMMLDKPLSEISREQFASDIRKTFGNKVDDMLPQLFGESFNLRQEMLIKAKNELATESLKAEFPDKSDAEIKAELKKRENERKERRDKGTLAKKLARLYDPTVSKQKQDVIDVVNDIADPVVADYAEKIITNEVRPVARADRKLYTDAMTAIRDAHKILRDEELVRKQTLVGSAKALRDLEREEFLKRDEKRTTEKALARAYRRLDENPLVFYGKELLKILGESRSILASGDLSGSLLQGFYSSVTNPLMNLKGSENLPSSYDTMIKAITNKESFTDRIKSIENHQDFDIMKQMGVEFAEAGGGVAEENIRTEYLKAVPVVKNWLNLSERTYAGFLDVQRALWAESVINELRAENISFRDNPEVYKAAGALINVATGRGNIGRGKLKSSIEIFGGIFFAPRFVVSRAQLLVHVFGGMATLPPGLRKIEAKRAARFHTAISLPMLALIAAGIVAVDPDDDDFLKIRVGDKARYEVTGGLQQYIKLIAQLGMTVKNVIAGDQTLKAGTKTAVNKGYYFGVKKLAPVPSYINAALTGKEPDTTEFNWLAGIGKRLTPITVREVGGAAVEDGVVGAALTLPTLFGINVGYYQDKMKKAGSVDAMLNGPEVKRMTTDDLVTLLKEDYETPADKRKVEMVLKKKALAARQAGTLTQKEVDNIKKVLPDFNITARDIKKKAQ